MDFAAEREAGRVVLLYTRPSPTWRRWPWQSRALFPSLCMHVDELGVFDVPPGVDMVEAIADAVAMPLDVVREGLAGLFASRTAIAVESGAVMLPRFPTAQRPGDPNERDRELARERARRYRQRKRGHNHQEAHSGSPQLELIASRVTHRPETPAALDEPAFASRRHAASRDASRPKGVGSEVLVPVLPHCNSENSARSQIAGARAPTNGHAAAAPAGPPAVRTTIDAAASPAPTPTLTTTRAGRVYTGRLASSGELAEIDWTRRTALAALPPDQRRRVPPFTADVAELGPGVARALDEYGADTVRDVVSWATIECAGGRLSPRHYRALFNGDSFPQRVIEAAAHVAGEAADQHAVDPALAAAIAQARADVERVREALAYEDERRYPDEIRPAIEEDLRRREAKLTELLARSRRTT